MSLLLCVALLVSAVLGVANFHPEVASEDRNGLCAVAGVISSQTAKNVTTFFKNKSNAQAVAELCKVLTPKAFKLKAGDVLDCDTVTIGSGANARVMAHVSIDLVDMAVSYECKFFVINEPNCDNANTPPVGGGEDDDDDRKRDVVAVEQAGMSQNSAPCNTFNTYGTCTVGCDSSLFLSCPCFWDDPTNPNGFPVDMGFGTGNGTNCTPENPCCWNRPCDTFEGETSCAIGGGGSANDTAGTIVFARCEWRDTSCQCVQPLTPVPLPVPREPTPVLFAPFDCLCPTVGANTSSVAQCIALMNPTVEQQRQSHRFSYRAASAIGKSNSAQFRKSCKQDKVCLKKPNGKGDDRKRAVSSWSAWFISATGRIRHNLRGVPYEQETTATSACFVTPAGWGPRVQSIANAALSQEDLQAIEPIIVESTDPAASAPALFVSLSAALAAIVATLLM